MVSNTPFRKRAVFLDVDGTLIDHGYPLEESTRRAVQQARENGHLMFICTGRGTSDVQEEIRNIGFDGEITNGGAHADVDGKTVLSRSMPRQDAIELISHLQDRGLPILIQTHDQTYVSEYARDLMVDFDNAMRARREAEIAAGGKATTDALPEGFGAWAASFPPVTEADLDQVAKVLFVTQEQVDLDEVAQSIGERYHLIPGSMPLYDGANAEICQAGVTKGDAIASVLDYLGMDPEDAVGIGDSWNDVEMFDLVGDAVAMDNASEGVKARADHITTGVHDDGVRNAFLKLGLI